MNLDQYRKPVAMSDVGQHATRLAGLPPEPGALAKTVQGLMIHQHIAPTYGVTLGPDQRAQSHLRPVDAILDEITARDARPLSAARAPGERQVGVCRHFTLLHVAMLRTHGIPARARCGFGAYFEKGRYIDHWVTEYWSEQHQRWQLFDAQLDEHQRELFKISFDPANVPRDQFVIAGDAWQLCRSGNNDPDSFGILHMHGLWFIAGNLIRDIAALNNREMLPWDIWGAMRRKDSELDLALFDRLAAVSREPDAHAGELGALFADERVSVPKVVFNAELDRMQEL
ncbi:transglutaminase domain-containing protein [Bradyrhizobium jicamae]|uniref:Transglutaminase domain-containing protein n=1 Tax=Bradyrhizobium jicamae TaxID=280332 RepID=A0ABS5FX44_9BRAD|nr:transglutaminase-like domain-containing protein [Bradyrhizobium jicamae]MBR0801362.1 transglutaminase domain-containing protein [Bradyrhizobium jicamae]MBR0937342.1 transglutaminase domain-containing protein [Bradyrhizobium jicamae]